MSTVQENEKLEGAVDQIEKVQDGAVSDPYNFASRPEEWHREFKKRLLRKVDLRLLPMLCLMFLMSYLDRR